MLATERGYRVHYFETTSLVLALKAAAADNRLESALRDIAKADLLIIDEYCYIPVDIEDARLPYQVMSASYEARSMIATTNIKFGKWGTVLGDAHLATATVPHHAPRPPRRVRRPEQTVRGGAHDGQVRRLGKSAARLCRKA